MSIQRRFKQALVSVIFGSSLHASTASAADLPCVHRAIDWLKTSKARELVHVVKVSAVTLHSNGIAGYASGMMSLSKCSLKPLGLGSVDCLTAPGLKVLLSDRVAAMQPFNVEAPMSLDIRSLHYDSAYEVKLVRPSATYAFSPQCAGDLLIGNDQWGNHWSLSFQLDTAPPPPR